MRAENGDHDHGDHDDSLGAVIERMQPADERRGRRWRIDRSVSLANILAIVAAATVGIAAWYEQRERVNTLEVKVGALEARSITDIRDLRDDIREIRSGLARLLEQQQNRR